MDRRIVDGRWQTMVFQATKPALRRFTVDEYHAMARAGILRPDERVELIDGEIWEMTPIGEKHNAGVLRISDIFSDRLGRAVIVGSQGPVRLAPRGEPQPDIVLLRRRADYYASGHPTPNDVLLLIEVSDTTVDFDRNKKMPAYAQQGIAEAWLVNLAQDQLEVHRDPSADGYRTTLTLRRGETVAPLAFPDCVIPVAEILG